MRTYSAQKHCHREISLDIPQETKNTDLFDFADFATTEERLREPILLELTKPNIHKD